MKIGGGGGITQPLGKTAALGGGADDLADKLKNLGKDQLEELIKAAQTYGPKIAMQMAQQLMQAAGPGKIGDFNLSDINGDKPRGTSTARTNSEDLEKLLKDILKKQESVQADQGAQGAGMGSQGQHRPQQDVNQVQTPDIHAMY